MLKRPISLVWARTSRLFTRQYDAKAAAAAALKEAEEAERELASKRRDVGRGKLLGHSLFLLVLSHIFINLSFIP